MGKFMFGAATVASLYFAYRLEALFDLGSAICLVFCGAVMWYTGVKEGFIEV